ncbi:hypothetical protein FisN_17Lh034 [Fistulifera solaris]|uniref:HMG box domain-containing protein n=1 Tax=Fistulifera solaris TaxID=1519565 RepID=A0A1Z5J5S1_FISSO|nr:hypothetical protein FisN_17Lh034 [Fistulifera solaris]|eukprot:GAX09286.1 hypothetical protein FisN_17Lh034 [Fistulifera solaris]
MDPLAWQQMELQARLHLDNDMRAILNQPRGNTTGGSVGQNVPETQLSRLAAIRALPPNAFGLVSNQAGPLAVLQQSQDIQNGQLATAIHGMQSGMTIPLSHGSSPLVVINAADLSRLIYPVVTTASPIIILPSLPLQRQGNDQPFAIPQVLGMQPQHFVMPCNTMLRQPNLGLQNFSPGVSQDSPANQVGNERLIPEKTKSARPVVGRQDNGSLSLLETKKQNPLELLAAASSIPNSNHTNPLNTGHGITQAYIPSIVPFPVSDSYQECESTKTKPKRPLSAYNIFFRDERAKIIAGELSEEETLMLQSGSFLVDQHTSSGIKESRRKQPHRKAGFQELARIIAARWKRIDPGRLQMYEKMSALGRMKYSRDLQLWAQREKKDVMKPIQRLVERNMEKVGPGIR